MLIIERNKDKLDISIEFCKNIDIKVIDNNYLLIDFKEGKINLYRDKICCDFCGDFQKEEKFLNYKGILFCENCLKEIKLGEIGTIIY